jgi:hypothetical protein
MRSTSTMRLEVFDAVIQRFRGASAQVVKFHLNWRGEPTSNPHLPDMLARLASSGWDVEWHTNGTMLHRKRAVRIVTANPQHSIFVSLDGGNAAAFERNRGPGTWLRALRGLEALLEARGSEPWPRIGIYQLDLGVPRDQYDHRFLSLIDLVDRYVVVKPIDVDGGSIDTVQPRTVIPTGPCFWLGNALAVDIHGGAWTCLLGSGTRLGSLLHQDVDDLLSKARALRGRVEAETRAVIPGCSRCRKEEGAVVSTDT